MVKTWMIECPECHGDGVDPEGAELCNCPRCGNEHESEDGPPECEICDGKGKVEVQVA